MFDGGEYNGNHCDLDDDDDYADDDADDDDDDDDGVADDEHDGHADGNDGPLVSMMKMMHRVDDG
eukprot:1951773-Karenia_brevis.AAC.2